MGILSTTIVRATLTGVIILALVPFSFLFLSAVPETSIVVIDEGAALCGPRRGRVNGETLSVVAVSNYSECCQRCQEYVAYQTSKRLKCIAWTLSRDGLCRLKSSVESTSDFERFVYGTSERLHPLSGAQIIPSSRPLQISPSWRSKGSQCYEYYRDWFMPYKEMHEKALKDPDSANFLVYICNPSQKKSGTGRHCGGLGDMMRGVVLTFILATATNRAILIDWTKPTPIEDFYAPNEIEWRFDTFISRNPQLVTQIGETRELMNFHHWDEYDFPRKFKTRIQPVRVNDVEVWEILKNPKVQKEIQQYRLDEFITESKVHLSNGCIMNLVFKTSEYLQELVFQEQVKLGISTEVPRPQPLIGIHARVQYYGDATFRQPHTFNKPPEGDLPLDDEVIGHVVDCVHEYEKLRNIKNAIWYVTSDQKEAKYKVKELSSSEVVFSEVPIVHIDRANATAGKLGAKWTFLEFEMLRQSDYMVLSLGGFAWQAANLGLFTPQDRYTALPRCEPNDGSLVKEHMEGHF